MPGARLFALPELIAAFELLLTPENARVAAIEWFELRTAAGEVDDDGFVHDDRDPPTDAALDAQRPPAAVAVRVWPPTSDEEWERRVREDGYEKWFGRTEEQIREFLPVRPTEEHVGLVALVSPETARRLQASRGWSDETMRRLLWRKRVIVESMQARGHGTRRL